ncbi:MAG: tetratricopeptide repeat protein [Thermoguttaceae bacterium]|nr:tetratricopeptide repeat protein [Thermoguttaceae bacterium]
MVWAWRYARSTPADAPRPVASLAAENTAQREAFAVCDRLLEDFPHDADALALRGALLSAWGQMDEALRSWEACLRLDPAHAAACDGIGKTALRAGDFEKAASMYRRAVAAAPGKAEPSLGLGKALLEGGQPDQAASVLESHVARWPDSAEALHLLGEAYLAVRRPGDAKKCFDRVVQARAASSRTYYGLMTACRRLGDTDLARRYEDEFRRRKEQERTLAVADRRDHWDERSVERRLADTYLAAAGVYQSHGDAAQAIACWRQAAAADRTHLESRQLLAMALAQTGALDEAIRATEELQRIEPQNPQHWLAAGRLHAQRKRWDAAEASLRKAVELAPRQGELRTWLAVVCLQSGRNPREAARLARAAVDVAPTVQNYCLLSEACSQSGDRAGAIEALRRARELDPGNLAVQEAYRRLQEASTRP